MKRAICELPPETADVLELGVVLGQNQSFGALAGRCSAAQAETLLRLRQGRKYQKLEPQWRDFCSKYLHMSGSQADRLIGLLEEFGPRYFELAQLTRVSPETFRGIAPALKDGALHHNGEIIEISTDNAQKVAAAVKQLRAAAPAPVKTPVAKDETPEPVETPQRMELLEEQGWTVLDELRNVSREECSAEDFARFQKLVKTMLSVSLEIYKEHGMR